MLTIEHQIVFFSYSTQNHDMMYSEGKKIEKLYDV